MNFKIRVLSAILALTAMGQCYGQILQPSGPRPSFEVAIIKPTLIDSPGRASISPKGDSAFLVRSATVKELIAFAFTTDSDRQIVGLSGWMSSDKFDIDAKPSDDEIAKIQKLSPVQKMDTFRLMQQSLLGERFHLKVHFETRGMPVYALVIAKGGPKMKAAEMNPSKPSETLNPPSLRVVGRGELAGTGATVAMLAEMLERQRELGDGSGRTVVDKTGLTGLYDWKLRWTPLGTSTDAAQLDETGPTLFTALQEQLGLKLESTKSPVEVVVIDHIERPSVN